MLTIEPKKYAYYGDSGLVLPKAPFFGIGDTAMLEAGQVRWGPGIRIEIDGHVLYIVQTSFLGGALVARSHWLYLLGRLGVNVVQSCRLTRSYVVRLLDVWGLATCEWAVVPQWRDIHAIGWICRRLKC